MKKLMIVFLLAGSVVACNSEDKKGGEEKKEEKKDAGSAAANEKAITLIAESGCTTCHKIDEKVIGPAYRDVAKKYENTSENVEMLVKKVIEGGSGNWGAIPMTAHPQLKKEDVTEMVRYILSLEKK